MEFQIIWFILWGVLWAVYFIDGDTMRPVVKAIVEATTFYKDPAKIAKVSRNLGEAMVGINIDTLTPQERMQDRGL